MLVDPRDVEVPALKNCFFVLYGLFTNLFRSREVSKEPEEIGADV